MPHNSNTVLYEEIELYAASSNGRAVGGVISQKRRAPELNDQGGLLISPDSSAVAVLDSTATLVTVLHSREDNTAAGTDAETPSRDLAVVRSFQPTRITGGCLSAADTVAAYCWSADSSRLALACSSGHVYVLDRSGQPVALLQPCTLPWAGKLLGAMAMPLPSTLFLLTARPAQLFVVPLDAPSRVLQSLRPQQLSRQHDIIRVAAYDARTSTLVVAGEGGTAGGGAKAAGSVHISVSSWRLELPGPGPAAVVAAKAVLLGSFTGPIHDIAAAASSGASSGAAWSRRRWTLSLSPLGEHVALVAPPAPGVLLLSLPQCQRVEPAERFGGRTAPRASAFQTTLARSVGSAVSASWWSSETALALSDLGGYVGLAQLPGYENLLAGDEQPKYEPGVLVASKTAGPGARGLLVLEPVMSEAKPGSMPASASDAKRGPRMSRGAAAPLESETALGPPGLRLLLLAERTPEEMLRVHMRHQQWGRALELCAAAGLDADRVYAARWASRPVDAANIADNLAKMADRRWVVEECCQRIAADYEGQRKLINYGLRETARQAKPAVATDSTDDASSTASATATPGGAPAAAGGGRESTDPRDAVWWWCTRLRLWRHSDRLEVLYAAQGRTFNSAAYNAFRDLPVATAAGSWAATGAVGPLAVLAQHYPASLSGPVLLGVLSRLPETINPRLYSALLPRVDGEGYPAPPPPPPVRKLDWVEQAEVLAEIRSVLAAGAKPESATGVPDLDPEATDALVRVLAPRPRLSVNAISEWYADRALQLDAETGQLQNALTLLELGWERGARGPRVAQLLGAARALGGVVGTTAGHHGSRLAGGALWQLRLDVFAAMQGGQQLRLLLSGTDEKNMAEELRDRVVPFLHGPGLDPAAVGPLVEALLTTEMAARPEWAAALIDAEAQGRMLFASTGELVQAVTAAVVGCPQTDEWSALMRAVEAVEAAVWKEAEAEAETGTTADGSLAAAVAGPAGGWMAGLRELRGFVRAGSLLAARGLPLTVRHISSCGHEEAARCVRQVLGGIQRSSPSMSDASWSELWRDLLQVRSMAFPFLAPEELLSEVARCMMHCGRNDLANAYLHGGAPGGPEGGGVHVALDSSAADALVVSVAMEILAGATDPWDSAAQQSAACLALASPEAPTAIALRRLMSALQMLPDMGLDLMPAQVMHMQDRFEVLRLILEGPTDGALVNDVGFAAAGVGIGVGIGGTFGLAASAALGGKFSRRRAAVRAAGKAAAAGGRAAAALAGSLLAVAGRVAGANVAEVVAGRMAPVAGIVAGAVAATVSAAAAAAPSAAVSAVGGAVQPPYKQVGRLLELAELLGLDSPEDELRVKDLAGRAALRAGDLATAQHLALGLLARRHVPSWSLCADVGSARQLQDDVVRQQLLSFALLHCPAERMTRLLEDLRAAEKRCSGEGDVDPPAELLRVALLAPGQRVGAARTGASPTACLPSPGDTHLALAVLGPGLPGSGTAPAKLLEGLHGSGGTGEDGSVGLPYAQQQRMMSMECYCHCLRALLPTVSSGTERLQLLEQPLGELLRQVRQLDLAASGSSAESAAAALAAEARLVAARDSRTVRQHVPGVDAVQFASGGEEYRRQAILQQAALAGAAEAEAPGASPRAAELLEQARQLACVYGVDTWDVELHFTSALITACSTTTPELRAAVQSREPGLLQRPSALLRHLAAVTYPALPPSSGPHLALWLVVLTDCLHACAKDDPTAATLAATTAPLFSKLRDLLEKAGAALKGLALTHVHAPFLAQLLAPLAVELAVPSAASSEAVTAASVGAAAIFSYVKPSNLTQAVKLLAALHKLLGPQVKKTTSGSGAPFFPDLQRALDELPASLPYLCLCVKAVGTKSTAGSGGLQHHQQAQLPQRDMAVAWGHVAEHVVRLSSAQLAAWLAFLLLPGSPCPLGPAITGAPLSPCPCPVDVRLMVLDACMPKLQTAAAMVTPPSAVDVVEAQGSGAAAAVDQELLCRLRSLHRRLLVLRAARQHAADGVDEEQLRNLELSLLHTEETPSGTSDVGTVRIALSNLAAAGCPAAVLLDIAAVAADLPTDGADPATGPGCSPSPSAQALVEGAVHDALSSALQALLGEEMQATTGQLQLRGVLKCLDRQPHMGSNTLTLTSLTRAEGAETLRTLRDLTWRELQRFTDERLPAVEQLRPTAASELLDMQAALGTRTMWQDWVFSGGSSDDPTQHRLRLIATRTRALLAHMRTPQQSSPAQEHNSVSVGQCTASAPAAAPSTVVQVEDLATCAAAEQLFRRLLQAARTSGNRGDTVGTASLVQLQLLARLLVEVWRNGDIWGPDMPVHGNEEDNGDSNGAVAGVAEAPVEVSALHRCWRELAEELLRGRHLVEVVSILNPPGSAPDTEAANGLFPVDANKGTLQSSTSLPSSCKGHLLPLSSDDVEHLIRAAAASADGAAASWCLGLASPYKEHRIRVLEELQATSFPADDALGASTDPALAGGIGPILPDTAVLLLALLVWSGDAVQLAASAHPLLLRLVSSVPVSPVEAAAWQPQAALLPCRDARTAGYVLPCLAALLTERGKCGFAAVLVSRRLQLHPALASATGSLVLLERYLKAEASVDGKPAGACQVSSGLDSAGDGLLRCWPAAMEQLQLSCKEWCRRALRALTAATTE
ncbi:hypothetical protein Vretimale_2528 [Volvox reticuliferus]|uniref:Uncharacterized protein n=1 Tax=Volvox reticuliferus TaxID=1737510 RepID=A0A8J4G0F8_9CHLO|nr:hypothetical protein Vretifemale_4768 [Volvox reticuliferus]GIL96723.1 hypothetical protein Vretimale_2528 [Volvox reticuliferus]